MFGIVANVAMALTACNWISFARIATITGRIPVVGWKKEQSGRVFFSFSGALVRVVVCSQAALSQ